MLATLPRPFSADGRFTRFRPISAVFPLLPLPLSRLRVCVSARNIGVPASVRLCCATARLRELFARFGGRQSVHFAAELFLQFNLRGCAGNILSFFTPPVSVRLDRFPELRRPKKRRAARCRRIDQTFTVGVLAMAIATASPIVSDREWKCAMSCAACRWKAYARAGALAAVRGLPLLRRSHVCESLPGAAGLDLAAGSRCQCSHAAGDGANGLAQRELLDAAGNDGLGGALELRCGEEVAA